MKKILILVLLFGLFVMVGCQPKPLSREELDNIDRIIDEAKESSREILGEKRHREIWGDDERPVRKPDIELQVKAGCEEGVMSANVTIKNRKTSRIFVCSSDFTLKLPGGLTVNPTSGSVNTFEGIELNNGETTQGIVYFEHTEIGKSGIYYLNFNHYSDSQQFAFRRK